LSDLNNKEILIVEEDDELVQKINSITVANAPELTDFYVFAELSLSILDNIHGLENTSLIRFDFRGTLKQERDKERI
jgi:hypothetical protein